MDVGHLEPKHLGGKSLKTRLWGIYLRGGFLIVARATAGQIYIVQSSTVALCSGATIGLPATDTLLWSLTHFCQSVGKSSVGESARLVFISQDHTFYLNPIQTIKKLKRCLIVVLAPKAAKSQSTTGRTCINQNMLFNSPPGNGGELPLDPPPSPAAGCWTLRFGCQVVS